jgi:6-phosphogluconolactonase
MRHIRVNNSGEFAPIVKEQIKAVGESHNRLIRIAVPGGRGSVPVIQGLLQSDQAILERVILYLVDERLTGATNLDTLMDVGLKEAIEQNRFKREQLKVPSLGSLFFDFEGYLDLIYLGVGEDGHIASLFPGSYPALDSKETEEIAHVADSPKPPAERATVSYRGFKKYGKKSLVYLLFFGEGKRGAYQRLVGQKENPATLPCMFFPRELFNITIVTDLEGSR